MKKKVKVDFKSLPRQAGVEPVDRSQWSAESQRTYSLRDVYRDIEFNCRACGTPAVFSASEQKRYYEVKKAHVDKRRVFCPACFLLSIETARGIRVCEQAWKQDRRTLRTDAAFLSHWLALMAQHRGFDRIATTSRSRR